MQIFFILLIPLLMAVISLFIKNPKRIGIINTFAYYIIALLTIALAYTFSKGSAPLCFFNFFYIDALSIFFIFTISIISMASSLYSIEYIAGDVKEGAISGRNAKVYYALFNLFSFSMFFVTVVNNLGMLWAAIEMTTLASTFLVGFYNTKTSIEAAWKYIIICSVGIALALLGTILFYYTASVDGGIKSLNWTDMVLIADKLNPNMLKAAFIFILVGYGTKAGLVPMHTWLPDAHSQALTPISALLSGVLLKTAIYAILRFTVIVNKCIGAHFSSNLFIFFGILSLGIAAGFILVQKDIKRLLAYSSIEHIAIIFIGLGISGTLAIYGALLHVFNHAVTKSLMFFGAGNIVKKYKTNNMHLIKGVMQAMPFAGILIILGVFAICGSPPFSIFISEIIILIAAFTKGSYLAGGLFLLFIAIIFGAFIYNFGKMIFGKKPENMPVYTEPFTTKIAFIFLFIFICTMGLAVPGFINNILTPAVNIVKGA